MYTKVFEKALLEMGELKIQKEYSTLEKGGVYYNIGFLSEKETIIVKRSRW